MGTLTLFRRTERDIPTLSPVAPVDTFESRFWTAMVIVALFVFYLSLGGEAESVQTRF